MKPEHLQKLRDKHWRLNNLYFITNKQGKKVRFRMTSEQLEYFQGLHTRNIILKARQLGFTTEQCIIQLDAALFESAKCALIAHTLNDAKSLFREKIKYAYDNLPAEIKLANPARNDAAGELVFAKGGSLYVSTSFRGGTLRYLHVSEFGKICAKFPHKAREIVTGGAWELWEETKEGKDYVLLEQGETSLDAIPFVPFYGRRTGFMMGISPLLDLAFLNVKHWQSQSDQDTILHVARVPILFMKGFPNEQAVTVGASSAVKTEAVDAEMKYVEHTGAAIEARFSALDKLEGQMIQTGAELLIAQPGQRSATEANNDAEANKSELQRIIEQFEDSIDQCLQFMADWAKLGDGGHVSVFKDFAAGSLSDVAGQLILSFQQGGLITKKTAITQAQRIGILSPDLVPDDELAAVAEEGPTLGTM
ncbi:DUF4055 domain-containing protein [Alcaligenaceae bacterium]|nr:DUF4055 domain-containing protein [Alcaligenaceae bacterium]